MKGFNENRENILLPYYPAYKENHGFKRIFEEKRQSNITSYKNLIHLTTLQDIYKKKAVYVIIMQFSSRFLR